MLGALCVCVGGVEAWLAVCSPAAGTLTAPPLARPPTRTQSQQAAPIQDWLRAACLRAARAPPAELPDGLTAADWAAVRQQAFPPSEVSGVAGWASRLPAHSSHTHCVTFDRCPTCSANCTANCTAQDNEYAHLRPHDFSDTVHRLPPEEIHGMMGAGEPACLCASRATCVTRPVWACLPCVQRAPSACCVRPRAVQPLPPPDPGASAPAPPSPAPAPAGAAGGGAQLEVAALEAEMRALAAQMQAQPDMTEEELQQVTHARNRGCPAPPSSL